MSGHRLWLPLGLLALAPLIVASDAPMSPFEFGQTIGKWGVGIFAVLVVIALIGDAREKAVARRKAREDVVKPQAKDTDPDEA